MEQQGYLVLWNLPDISCPFDRLEEIAAEIGFDKTRLPHRPKRRGAWEKATNLGAKGIKINPQPGQKAAIIRQYGYEPKVRLHTEIISAAAPRLIRHIVRTVTLPDMSETQNKTSLAERQLDSQTVCIMEFFTSSEKMRSTGAGDLPDRKNLVNGNLRDVIRELMDSVDRKVNHCDGNDLRNAIRAYLLDLDGILMSAGGAYFIPQDEGVAGQLKSIKVLIEAMNDWRGKKNSRPAQVMVVPVIKTDNGFDVELDIAQNAIAAFKDELQQVVTDLQPILDGQRSVNVTEKNRMEATETISRLNDKIGKYQKLLGDELAAGVMRSPNNGRIRSSM